jgi:mannose-1-phosphate guanylyltransferase/mannose-6-phosphate isomerase
MLVAKLQPVLLSGGSGTRLWPLSREAYPKQFLPLVGQDTMLQATWRRVAGLADAAPIVVAGEEHRFLVAEQLRQAGAPAPAIVLEPVGRNTAPAIAAAALQATADGDDPLLLVLPSDHVVADAEAFRAAVRVASAAAERGALVTFGIVPTAPETGFGYIQADAGGGDGVRKVVRFVEKPDAATAQAYLATGGYYWNSGMFLFRASRYLAELERLRPDILAATRVAFAAARRDGDFIRLDKEAFAACPSQSIDYAVMEATDAAMVLPVDIGWNDVGSWSALWDVAARDADGNAHHGDVIAVDSRNSYAYARRLVALVGVDDVVVVETDDAVLVARKDKVQKVKDVVALLKQEGAPALGQLRFGRPGRALPGQADQGQARRAVVAAVAHAARRALDRGQWHRAGDPRQRRVRVARQPVDLHPDRGEASAGEPGHRGVGADRGAVRRLSRRRRHRPLRGRIRTQLTGWLRLRKSILDGSNLTRERIHGASREMPGRAVC